MKKVVLNCDDRIVCILMSTVAMENYNASFSQNAIDLRETKAGETLEIDYAVSGKIGIDAEIELNALEAETEENE